LAFNSDFCIIINLVVYSFFNPSFIYWCVPSYVIKLPDIFYFQGQVFIFCNFLCFSFGKVMGQGNCYIYASAVILCLGWTLYQFCWRLPFYQFW
jgi:hypothetical protein